MVPARSWRDHFQIDDKILQAFWSEFQESSPLRASELNAKTAAASVEFVLWCVREGHFTEADFTRYQSEAFNLPVIRDDFFSSPIDHDFWARVKDLHSWTASCVPLTEWEGYMLIGSVWPEETIKTSLRHRLVLATPSNLRAHYDRFQSKGAPAPFTMPNATIAPPPPVKAEPPPPVVAEPPPLKVETPVEKTVEPVAAAKTEKKPEIKFDPADPFAALSRELGLMPDETKADEHATTGEDAHGAEAPDGLVIPEGLSFDKDELSRLVGLDTSAPIASDAAEASSDEKATSQTSSEPNFEPGTVVHDFETGEGEVVARKQSDFAASLQQPMPAQATPMTGAIFELEPIPETPENPEVDLDATQPSIVKHDFPPPPTVVPPVAEPPPVDAVAKPPKPTPPSLVIPFAPVVTPTQPAMVKPAAPEVAPPPLPSTPDSKQPQRPVPEATIVVQADETVAEPQTPKTPRRPLFEPASDSPQSGPITGNIPKPTFRPASSITQTGTRGRRLESTPVTSFFGMGGAAGPSLSKSRNANDYSGRVVSISKLQPIHLDQCSSVDEAGAQALLQACNIFETAMILLFKDGELQPWKWNDLFLSVNGERPDAVDLQEPSIFKVVFRTAKPYHGYVVTSTVNQKFFNEFYRGMLPKHATVIPIMIDGRMGGMLLCFTNSKIDYRQSLRLMERLSFDLARVFKSLRTNAKAS
jgi:hypothetical protein